MSNPPRSLRLGIIVPSSNTQLEPTITHLIQTINTHNITIPINVIPHYTRLRVTEISLSSASTSQFDLDSFLAAASLLADADVHAIAWGGTSAGWLGIETDRKLCAAITERFGIPATTSTLAFLEYMGTLQPEEPEVALLTPYVPEMNEAIRKNFAKEGINVVDDRGLSITENKAIADVTMRTVGNMLDEVMHSNAGVRFVTVFCTNLSVAGGRTEIAGREGETVAKGLERRHASAGRELTVLDSVALTVWGLLRVGGVDVKRLYGLKRLGRLFAV